MYLPRNLISLLYNNLVQFRNSKSLKVLVLAALEPDALCACRILTTLFKRDNILHHIIPIAGYGDLARVGENEIQRMRNEGDGGTVICLGVGGLVDLGDILGLDPPGSSEDVTNGIEVWVIDARRPWNLGNVFGGTTVEDPLQEISGNARRRKQFVDFGEIKHGYRSGRGGIIIFDDGDISQELETEREAYYKLEQMPEIEDLGDDDVDSDSASSDGESSDAGRKRKAWSDEENEDYDGSDEPPSRRRRSNSGESIPSSPSAPRRRGLLVTNGSILPDSFQSRQRSPRSHSPPSREDKPPSARKNRQRLLKMKRKHESVLQAYYSLGITYSEPISSLLYSLVSDLGREDNNALWNAIVGVSSLELYGRSITGINPPPSELNPFMGWGGDRAEGIKQVLRDEVRRLNPPDPKDMNSETARGHSSGILQTTAVSPTDTSIRLSPEPRLLLVRHWSLLDSMVHSPYLASRLNLWSDIGRRRLDKLLAKMGFSKKQCNQNYTHMDMDLKRSLRQSFLKYAPMYNLDALAPPVPNSGRGRQGWGFVRSWGWTGCFSAVDVAVIIGAILEVGKSTAPSTSKTLNGTVNEETAEEEAKVEEDQYVERFWNAYDALQDVEVLKAALEPTMQLHRAIHRTGTSIFSKHQLRHLRAFRIAVIKDGPDLHLFSHPGALTKLALWVGEAIHEQERDKGGKPTPLVLASLNERRGIYTVVGTGGRGLDFGLREKEKEEVRKLREQKKEDKRAEKEKKRAAKEAAKAERARTRDGSEDDNDDAEEDETENESSGSEADSDDEDDNDNAPMRNRFGNSFQEVVEETNARVRIESFDHCVVEVKKDDLGMFLEALSSKSVMS